MQRDQRQAEDWKRQMQAENANQLNAFTEAVDESGNKTHPHIEAVQETMAQLIYGRENMRRQNPGLPALGLDEAYDQACKLSPDIVGAQAKAVDAERLAKANADAKKATEAAKREKSGSTGKDTPEKSLRDEIRANIKAA